MIQFLPRRVVGKVGCVVCNYLAFVWHSCNLTISRASRRALTFWSKPIQDFVLIVKWSGDGSPNIFPSRYDALSTSPVDSWSLSFCVPAKGESLQLPGAGGTLIYTPNVKIILVLLFKRKVVCIGFFLCVCKCKSELNGEKKKEDMWMVYCTRSENQK